MENCHEGCPHILELKKENERLLGLLNRRSPSAAGPLGKAAERIYDHYKSRLRAGGAHDAKKSIVRLLKGGATVDLLLSCIDRARAKYDREKRAPEYYPQANNFFGERAYWLDFREDMKAPEEEGEWVTAADGTRVRVG